MLLEDTDLDSSFIEPASTEQEFLANHHAEWIGGLPRSDRMSLSIFMHDILCQQFGITVTDSDEVQSNYLGITARTIREWCSLSFANEGYFPDPLQGKYVKKCLGDNEDLNKQATRFIRANASVKGKPNLTAAQFVSGSMTICFQHPFLTVLCLSTSGLQLQPTGCTDLALTSLTRAKEFTLMATSMKML